MKPNDIEQKITAYALGELDETGKSEVEEIIKNNPELQEQVHELHALGKCLEMELKNEEAPALSEEQKAILHSRPEKIVPFKVRWGLGIFIPMAAVFALIFGGQLLRQPPPPESRCITVKMSASEPEEFDQIQEVPRMPPLVPKIEVTEIPQSVVSEFNAPGPPSPDMAFSPQPKSAPLVPVAKVKSPIVMKGIIGGSNPGARMRHNMSIDGSASRIVPGRQGMSSEEQLSRITGEMVDSDQENMYGKFGPSLTQYNQIIENTFKRVSDHALSTFSIDVDTASYSNIRNYITRGSLPPKDAIRLEEMINYFNYVYAPPRDGKPFATHLEAAVCPWAPQHKIVKIGIKGREIINEVRPTCNLVFLLDVSGSMQSDNKLPLVKKAMKMLVRNLNKHDRVAIVVYAGASGLVLPSTSCSDERAIEAALDRLRAGGSTNGGAGINLAYATAKKHFVKGGVNRVILCTDGDFNVGVTQSGDLVRLVEKQAKDGVFLSVLGFGMGNYKDSMLEQIADKGNGNYAYIDTFNEARKVLVDQLSGTLVTIAKDVKIQVEFNPAYVASYRLIGYENRMLRKEDFNDDTKDAGEIGAGHRVTALYEIVPVGTATKADDTPAVDPLKYQQQEARIYKRRVSPEMLTVKIRYKKPDGDTSTKLEFPLHVNEVDVARASDDFSFACSVASFGMLLRGSEYKGNATYDAVIEMANSSLGKDEYGYRRAFVDLVRSAKAIAGK